MKFVPAADIAALDPVHRPAVFADRADAHADRVSAGILEHPPFRFTFRNRNE
jgi:hypothetical protein